MRPGPRCSTSRGARVAACLWCWALLLIAGVASDAKAAPTTLGFALNRHTPAEAGSHWFGSESLDLRGTARPSLGLVSDFSYRPLVLLDVAGEDVVAIVQRQFFHHFGAALVLARRLRLSASLPLLLHSQGGAGRLEELGGQRDVLIASSDGSGLGDLRLSADVRLVGDYLAPFTLALGARVFAPTGARDQFTSDGKARFEGRALFAGQAGPFAYAGRAGVLFHGERDDFAGVPFGTDLTFGAAAGLRLLDGRVTLGPELWGSTVMSDSGEGFLERASSPVDVLLGTKVQVGSAIRLGAAAGTGVTQGLGSSRARLLVSLEWLAPAKPSEKAPPAPATSPPPRDRDGDTILDDVDACVNEPGVPSARAELHGCPAPDEDGDGIVDGVDACLRLAGLQSHLPERNGCPRDADGDGVADADDRCPHQPGEASTNVAQRGCPKARLESGEIKISERIEFASGSAELLPESTPVLSAVVELLAQHPEIERLSVEGHTDDRGSEPFNLELSRRRAAAVVRFLIDRGIEMERLSSQGFGPSRPIDDNATEAGRRNNRRVEFRVLLRDGAGEQRPAPAAPGGRR